MTELNRLANFEETIAYLKELDEKAERGFVIIGVEKGNDMTYHMSWKKLTPVHFLGALEQFKHMLLSQFFKAKTE